MGLIDAKGIRDYSDFRRAPHFEDAADYHLGVPGALERFEHVVEKVITDRIEAFNYYADEVEAEASVHLTDLPGLLRHAAEQGVRPPISPLIVLIDEFSELVLTTTDRRRFEQLVTSFVSARARRRWPPDCCDQRPSVDVVTGVMKSNFARLSLRVQSVTDLA